MSREQRDLPETVDLDRKTSRRDLLKRSLIVLGASAIVQATGGVMGVAQETPKKEDSKTIKNSSATGSGKGKKGGKGGKGKGKGHKGTGTITPDTPKKEGSSPVF